METVEPPVHYRIYVYDNGAPPLGQPSPVSLCPVRRRLGEELTGAIRQVTCSECQRLIRYLSLDVY